MKNIPKTFIINNYITLKLEKNITNIYINDEKFIQCKYLLLHIKTKNIPKYNEIDSIDDAEKIQEYINKNKLEDNIIDHKKLNNETHGGLDPETEFVGHCSNLQVWVENDYNPNLLHSNLSFPLLKKLHDIDVKLASIQLREAIAKKVESKNENVILFLIKKGYISLDIFTEEELNTIFNIETLETININLSLYKKLKKLKIKNINKIYTEKLLIKILQDKKHVFRDELKTLTLQQLENLYNSIPEEKQTFLRMLNNLINEKWLLSKLIKK